MVKSQYILDNWPNWPVNLVTWPVNLVNWPVNVVTWPVNLVKLVNWPVKMVNWPVKMVILTGQNSQKSKFNVVKMVHWLFNWPFWLCMSFSLTILNFDFWPFWLVKWMVKMVNGLVQMVKWVVKMSNHHDNNSENIQKKFLTLGWIKCVKICKNTLIFYFSDCFFLKGNYGTVHFSPF